MIRIRGGVSTFEAKPAVLTWQGVELGIGLGSGLGLGLGLGPPP